MSSRPLRVGISTRLMHSPPEELGFHGRTLLYLEQTLAHWIMSHRALTVMVPTLGYDAEVSRRRISVDEYVKVLDALVLQGGADVSPLTYGQTPIREAWSGDAVRDRYEIELIEGFRHHRKPVLGICRGAQLINVAFGGTLLQDIDTQQPSALRHVDADLYDELSHGITFAAGGRLAALYQGKRPLVVNSIHHQAIDKLGNGLCIEARSDDDGVIEAVRSKSDDFVMGVQWHPEFHWRRTDRLDPEPLLNAFLHAAAHRAQDDSN